MIDWLKKQLFVRFSTVTLGREFPERSLQWLLIRRPGMRLTRKQTA